MDKKMKEKTKQQLLKELRALQTRLSKQEKIRAEYNRAKAKLEESKERFRVVSGATFDAIWDWDLLTNKVAWNEGVKTLFGFSADELRPAIKWWEEHIHPEDRGKVVSGLQAIIDSGQKAWSDEYRFRCSNGSYASIIDRGYVIHNKKAKPVRMIGAMMDISERVQAKERLEILNQELLRSNRILKELTLRDSHTGLYNHRYLDEAIEVEFSRAQRYKNPLSVIMLDIDYFKSINDVYGHQFGDLVLKQLARLLKRTVRRYDIVIRFGGEEFVIISPGIYRSEALVLAERLLEAVNLYDFGNKKHVVELKISIAVACYPEDKIVKAMDLIELSDQILNKAKEHGGNCAYCSLDIMKEKSPALQKSEDFSEVKFLKEKIDKLTKRANQSLIEAIFAFAKTIKLKDRYTGEHAKAIVNYATDIAAALNLPKDEITRIKEASILHDLGKIGIGEKILLKKSKLKKEEFEEIKKHPQIGVDIIRPIQFLHNIIPLILYHHERWDGKGYPAGLKGEDIPLGARIVAIADVYQALISDRPYRKAYSKNKAIEAIKQGSGTQFDPKIVKIFLKLLR